MLNIEILEFKQAIQNHVRGSNLPDEVKRMVLEQIYKEQELITYEVMKQEIEERDKQEGMSDE